MMVSPARNGVDGYEWDIFLSYRRSGTVREWVQNHFEPLLRQSVDDEVGYEPRIFLDRNMEVGSPWRDDLADALHKSRLLIAVLSPPYFTSAWCVAEWETMRRRQSILRAGGWKHPVIYPIRYSDGDKFPETARNLQHEVILSDFRYPDPQFARTEKYLDFRDAVRQVAERIVARFESSPTWDPSWPVERPDPPSIPPMKIPRL